MANYKSAEEHAKDIVAVMMESHEDRYEEVIAAVTKRIKNIIDQAKEPTDG